jgi:hypothetical protein
VGIDSQTFSGTFGNIAVSRVRRDAPEIGALLNNEPSDWDE